MSNLIATNPNNNLKIKINGEFGNGLTVTGGFLAPVTSSGTRWINVWFKARGRNSKGNSAEVMSDGSFRPECADEDLEMYQAVYNAAVEQYGE